MKEDSPVIDILEDLKGSSGLSSIAFFFHLLKAMLYKRFHHTKRERSIWLYLSLLPAINILVGLLVVVAFYNNSFKSLVLSVDQYSTPVPLPLSTSASISPSIFNSNPFSKNVKAQVLGSFMSLSANSSVFQIQKETFSNALFSASSVEELAAYGALVEMSNLTFNSFVVYANNTGLHSLPIFMNLLSNSIMKVNVNSSASISVSNHPFPLNAEQQYRQDVIEAGLISVFITLAVNYVPAALSSFIIIEKMTKSKHSQLLSGAGILSYWIGNLLFDYMLFLIPYGMVLLLIAIAGQNTHLYSNFGPVALTFALYGFATVPLTYLFSFTATDPWDARVNILFLAFMCGPMSASVSFMLDLLGSPSSGQGVLATIFRIFPGYCLNDALIKFGVKLSGDQNIWQPNIAGNDLITLVWEGPLYFLLVLFFDYLGTNPYSFAKIRFFFGKEKDMPGEFEEDDSDVLQEKNDILDGKRKGDPVIVHGIRKVYDGERVAVKEGRCIFCWSYSSITWVQIHTALRKYVFSSAKKKICQVNLKRTIQTFFKRRTIFWTERGKATQLLFTESERCMMVNELQ
eukprot:TRINITY_DN7474_c0_g3_i3.p1 TRINITY_DN7474_c0_g3~~TRINITY_DN7474_c0_g3_i3.p1  ORF type:complete len:602 (+),score=129.61 TRINITY_DN7474_c0_g3_i3:92-1807(+)